MKSYDLHAIAARVRALTDRPVVVKFGGSVQDNPAQTRSIIADIAALSHLGLRPVVVHGGGKAVTAALASAGLQSRFVMGQRYTDEASLEVVERVLCGEVNRDIVERLEKLGVEAVALTSLTSAVLLARKANARDASGAALDLGLVGEVERVDTLTIGALADAGTVPVIAPVARDLETVNAIGRLNVNADLAAGEVARALKPRAFILVSDTPGIRVRPDDASSFAKRLSLAELASLRASGVIDGGMLPKARACEMAIEAGVGRVAIVDGREPSGLLHATLTDEFPGTLITA